MRTIYALHGVVPRREAGRFVHRNLADRQSLVRFFQRRREKFVGLHDAIHGTGDALTIDDGTVAARDAAVLARHFGHEVTLFVNPWNVETGEAYWFGLLNAALDSARSPFVIYEGQRIAMHTEGKQALRVSVKTVMTRLRHETDRRTHIREVMAMLGSSVEVPDFLRVLRVSDLAEMLALGIGVQNHGWSHIDLSDAPRDIVLRELTDAHDWLLSRLGIQATEFAVPFGYALPPSSFCRDLDYHWYLLDGRLPCGRIEEGVFNRRIEVRHFRKNMNHNGGGRDSEGSTS